jgi:phenylpyruvate tautomerase PptA (4-oxalocrotonate tautomerase family)
MPLWTIHHTPGIFSEEEKHQLASRITDHYERIGLPRFYVVTIFNQTRPGDFYVGGEPTPVGVRILIDHIARQSTDKESREQITRWIKRILHPYMEKHEGLHWEFHADETSPRRLAG